MSFSYCDFLSVSAVLSCYIWWNEYGMIKCTRPVFASRRLSCHFACSGCKILLVSSEILEEFQHLPGSAKNFDLGIPRYLAPKLAILEHCSRIYAPFPSCRLQYLGFFLWFKAHNVAKTFFYDYIILYREMLCNS